MAKLSRLIRLINLLSCTSAVPLEKICAVCGVTERTAYRYITDISEASVPVYFDRERGGYRLVNPQHIRLDHLTLSESVLLICALSIICCHVNDDYRRQYIHLIDKIQSSGHALVGEVLTNLEGIGVAPAVRPDYSERLSTSLIELAIANRWALRVEGQIGEQGRQAVEIRKPRLRYHQGWTVEDEGALPMESQDLKKIMRVDIL